MFAQNKMKHRRVASDIEPVGIPTNINITTGHGKSDEDRKLTVESFDNHIYFYADVDSDRALALIKEIQSIDEWLRTDYITWNLDKVNYPKIPMWLHICSPGGDLMAGLALADFIEKVNTPIYSIIEGYCASAATLISASCTKRFITPKSYMLIHQLSSGFWGTYQEFQDETKIQDMLMEELVDFYSRRSKMPKDRIPEMLQHDFWMKSSMALEYGFVDEVYL